MLDILDFRLLNNRHSVFVYKGSSNCMFSMINMIYLKEQHLYYILKDMSQKKCIAVTPRCLGCRLLAVSMSAITQNTSIKQTNWGICLRYNCYLLRPPPQHTHLPTIALLFSIRRYDPILVCPSPL